MPSPIAATLLADGLIAILRGRNAAHLDGVIDTLVESGVRTLEVTLNTPDALGALHRASARLGGAAVLGAGTVRSTSQARDALEAGARFLVSPHTDAEIGQVAMEARAGWLPGAFTATEVSTAWAAGATAVKLFPARLGGPRYLRDLREPLDDIPMVPTGGVSAESVADWFAAGAAAVGAGGPLVGDALDTGDLDGLRTRARVMVAAVRKAKP
ncbi:bifunctional 4-hydroxy-2-oxoglutarate aldolase/2-dehydro-3-deoxy-phosphogluconate aldolase [Rugosimonospora acidiphila]|uniref:Bifunctional 4-hydroxy-2-oxoglutarate aldolase/2-dehydro-3-deoxy-phosphogluconate aldolase n=1 Tax=Rugosimonospora acidiphila TaxID=556531 RepID=A0ABP9RXD8_9ACTN